MERFLSVPLACALLVLSPSAFGAAKKAPKAEPKTAKAVRASPPKVEAKGNAKIANLGVRKLEKLGLKYLSPPADVTYMGKIASIQGDEVEFTVSLVGDLAPRSFDAAKKAKAAKAPRKTLKEDKLPDGWNMQFETETETYVWVRRTIDGKAYQCSAIVTSPVKVATAEKACLTLERL